MADFLYFLFFSLLYTDSLASLGAPNSLQGLLQHQHQPFRNAYVSSPYFSELTSVSRQKRETSDDKNKNPIVNHHRINPAFNNFPRKRTKRNAPAREGIPNAHSPREKISRFIDYNGWSPMDVSDPMSNQPTLYYQPPSLSPVHFGSSPPSEEPLYPIVPKNPPVIVIRAAHPQGQIDRIYGTEKINYVHIDPSSNVAEAFTSGTDNNVKLYEVFTDRNPEEVQNSEDPESEFTWQPRPGYNAFTSQNIESNFKNNNEYSSAPNQKRAADQETIPPTNVAYNIDYFPFESNGQTFEIEPQESSLDYPADHSNVNNVLSDQQIEGTQHGKSFSEAQIKPRSSHELNPTPIYDDSEFSDKALLLDEDVYYYYDEEIQDPTLSNPEDLQASGSDPFASIISSDSIGPNFNQGPNQYPEDVQEQAASEIREQRVPVERRSLHELLRGFNGVQYDRYIFSASENDERSILHALPPSDFRFKQRSQRKFSENEPFKELDEPNFRPWYLIRTRADSSRKSKKNNHSVSKGRRLSGINDEKRFYDPFTKKPRKKPKVADTLTANSLSELLQIFSYVTTPSPFPTSKRKPKVTTKAKEFRYTQPTESPLAEDSTRRAKVYTTFRYTLPTSKLVPPTESPFETTTQGYDLPDILPPFNDSVIDTNSIDGYLFSESENAPEYSKPEALPNVIKIEEKEVPEGDKGIKIKDEPEETKSTIKPKLPVLPELPVYLSESKSIDEDLPEPKTKKMDFDAHRRGEVNHRVVIDTGNIELESRSMPSEPAPIRNYFIHQGHSKVQIFGSPKNREPDYTEPILKTNTDEPISTARTTYFQEEEPQSFHTSDNLNSEAETTNPEDPSLTEQATEPSVKSSTEATIDYPDYAWLRPEELEVYESPSGIEEVPSSGSFLPSAFQAFTKLFYGDLVPTQAEPNFPEPITDKPEPERSGDVL